ncbi:fatty-acid-CoA ligase [Mycobacterium tuberculosis]|nr:fatty-acid-CoA ligase [Mycobacterium tuberculosis]CNF38072.1 fatty-acid-CoA ligase [Mycobacterium tuberculosis]
MSVISTLRDRATTTPSDEAFVFMDYDTKTGDQIDRMTWSQLYSRVTAVSAYLISYGRHAADEGPQRYQLRKVWTMLQDF